MLSVTPTFIIEPNFSGGNKYEFLVKKSRGTTYFFRPQIETFYDENTRQTLPSDVCCYWGLLN